MSLAWMDGTYPSELAAKSRMVDLVQSGLDVDIHTEVREEATCSVSMTMTIVRANHFIFLVPPGQFLRFWAFGQPFRAEEDELVKKRVDEKNEESNCNRG